MTKRIYIGIDAGKKTGVAVWDREKFISIQTTDFWGAIDIIRENNDLLISGGLIVVVEDPSQNKPVFKIVSVYNLTQGNHQSRLSAVAKVAQGVGSVKRESELIIEYCRRNEITVIPVKPTKRSMTKLDREQFKKITGYEGVTSEHARDAALLVYGR